MKKDSDDLTANIDKIHTTTLGARRIQKNLGRQTADTVKWCAREITRADKIIRAGKNWYVHTGNVILTVNVHSYTIITAHTKGASNGKSEKN